MDTCVATLDIEPDAVCTEARLSDNRRIDGVASL